MSRQMHVDDVIEGIFQRLCIRQEDGTNPPDRSMGLAELRLALGVTEAQMNEALWVLSFPGDTGSSIRPRTAWRWGGTGGSGARGRRRPIPSPNGAHADVKSPHWPPRSV